MHVYVCTYVCSSHIARMYPADIMLPVAMCRNPSLLAEKCELGEDVYRLGHDLYTVLLLCCT